MNSSLRILAAGVAGACALVFSGTALAAYNPSLIFANTNHALGGSGPVVIGLGQDQADDPTAAATIYAPPGYRVTLGQAPGVQLGTMSAEVKVGSLGGAMRTVDDGTLKVDNPANHVGNTCAPGLHEAVWVLEFSLLGNQFRIPIYVDRVTTGAEVAYASARMQICFQSPYPPPPQGSPSGAALTVVAFSVGGVFRSPGRGGSFAWNAVLTPFTPGTANPNTANAAQSTSYVRLPVQFAMTVKRQKRGTRTFALLTACAKEAGAGVRGLRVNFLSGRNIIGARRVATGRTNARGCAKARIRVRRAMILRALVDVPARQAARCQPTLAPRCSLPSIAPAFDLLTRARRVRR